MIFKSNPGWDVRWEELDDFAMVYETAVIPFSRENYLTEFFDFYRIKNRSAALVPSEDSFREALREVSGDSVWEAIAGEAERLFGTPERVMVFPDDAAFRALRDALEGPRGLAPFFFVFDMMFCEYEGFTLCFMSGTNN